MGNQQGKERRDYYERKIDWKNAERPSPPGKPYLVPDEGETPSDVITIRWSPPTTDGGAPITGYVVEHRRTGSPHWLRATPDLVLTTYLPLTGLEPGWRYQFRVSAENAVGRSDPGELSEPLTVTPQKWAASAPFFNVELQDTIGLENEKVEFKVQVVAIPPPSISWYKDGFEVFSSRRTKIVTENDQSTFIIHQAALEDEGEIKCTATNRAGYAVTKANLKLEAPPRIRLPRKYEDGLIFEKGELIRLKVSTAGRPRPEVFWYHNGEPLQKGGRFEIVESEAGSMVKILDACRDDRGEYVIKGVNKIGEYITSFLVTVTDRPAPPGKVQVTTIGRSVTLNWSSPEDDGGCKIGSYIVEYFRIGWDMWLKAKNSRQLSTTLEDLIEGSEYKFRVRAENPYGVSEPSEDSDIIFIPDPKRGILKPPPRKELPEVLKDAKRPAGVLENNVTETEESKRRRLLEEKAQKLLDTPLSVLLPYNNTPTIQDENMPPPVPKRKKGKGRSTPSPSLSDRSKATPSPVEKVRRTPSSVDSSFSSDIHTPEPKPEGLNGRIQSSEWLAKSGELKRNGQLKFAEQDPFENESPMYPRENDDSIMHGSSELMLVIYPRDRSKSVELSAQQRSEIEMSLAGDGVAPPMSLSAPELGATELFERPLIRDAISSTELLYERSMARLYQDRIDEESQRMVKRRYSMDRKSVERRASLKEPLEKRLSWKEEVKPSTQTEPPSEPKKKPEESMIPKPKVQAGNARERLSSVERERLEFAIVRERLKQKEEEKKLGGIGSLGSETSTTTTATSSSVDPDEIDDEYEDDDEDLEEEEEDYLDDKKKEDEEEEEDFDMDDDSQLKSPPITQSLVLPRPIKIAPFAEQEDITYHPRSMIPTRSIISKVEVQEKTEPQKPPLELIVTPPTPETPPDDILPKASKIPVLTETKTKKTSKLLKRFGLKKTKKIPEVTSDPVDPDHPPAVVPKPILKNKLPTRKKESPKTLLKLGLTKPVDKSMSEEESESEVGRKKKQVRIAEPKEEEALKKKQEKPEDKNAKENQVLIFHYSDIVKEFGGHKKPPARLYLNYDELKAHARVEDGTEKQKTEVKEPKPEMKISQPKAVEVKKPPSPQPTPQTPPQPLPQLLVQPTPQPHPLSLPPEREETPRAPQPEIKIRTSLEYATDVIMFIIACWLYLFKSEIYAIPVLVVMAYRQLKDITMEKYTKLKNSIVKLIPRKLRGKVESREE